MNHSMDKPDRRTILKQIVWDYNISAEEIDAVLRGDTEYAGHYTREKIFIRILESCPWFTIIGLFSPDQIKSLLTAQVIRKLRSPSLRKKYEFVQQRLQQLIPAAG